MGIWLGFYRIIAKILNGYGTKDRQNRQDTVLLMNRIGATKLILIMSVFWLLVLTIFATLMLLQVLWRSKL
jgi:hypothetical protein